MTTWTCPNTKCAYDKELQPGQRCPLCNKEAKEFKFSEFGHLLKKKNRFKKSIEKTKENKRILGKVKFCPTCGSTNIFWAYGFPQLWSLWECRECGYRGALVIEDSELATKIRERYLKGDEKEKTRKR